MFVNCKFIFNFIDLNQEKKLFFKNILSDKK